MSGKTIRVRFPLPQRLSAFAKLAMKDLAKVERSSRYIVSMDVWHAAGIREAHPDACVVCLAGAVMANCETLKMDYTLSIASADFSERVDLALQALNYLRTGSVEMAVKVYATALRKSIHDARHKLTPLRSLPRYTGVGGSDYVERWDPAVYEDDPVLWKKQMRETIKDLEAIGL